MSQNALVRSKRVAGRGAAYPTEAYIHQYKHRTAHAVAATSQAAVQPRLGRGLATSPATPTEPRRMGSGASKANAPKGAKRKKNDPRAQLERLVQGGNVRGRRGLAQQKDGAYQSALDDKSGHASHPYRLQER